MKGYVQIYTGDGKGKTTAALGLVLRAVASGMRVYIGQFAKGRETGELVILADRFPEVTAEQFGSPSFVKGEPTPQDVQKAVVGLLRVKTAMLSGEYDLVVADEAATACSVGLLRADSLLDLLDNRPEEVELVVTGRNADERLIEKADLVTEMVAVKHYFDAGVPARQGIEM